MCERFRERFADEIEGDPGVKCVCALLRTRHNNARRYVCVVQCARAKRVYSRRGPCLSSRPPGSFVHCPRFTWVGIQPEIFLSCGNADDNS